MEMEVKENLKYILKPTIRDLVEALKASRNFLELYLTEKTNAYQAHILEKALEKVGY